MKKWRVALYILWQWTWGLPQTLVGLLLFLIFIRSPHSFCHGAVHTKWKRWDGISLGMFIFTPAHEEIQKSMRPHEYGHTIQSLLLGPLYLLIIGLPSLVWASSKALQNYRKENNLPYSSFFVEHWADLLGARFLP